MRLFTSYIEPDMYAPGILSQIAWDGLGDVAESFPPGTAISGLGTVASFMAEVCRHARDLGYEAEILDTDNDDGGLWLVAAR